MGNLEFLRSRLTAASLVILAVASTSHAAVSWSVPSGVQAQFSYTDGQTINGKFGDGVPNSNSNGFLLTPTQFLANANGSNTPVVTSDTTSVTIHGNSDHFSVTGTFFGDYTILGTGSVNATGSLVVTNLDTAAVLSLPVIVSGVPASTVTSSQGGFYASTTVSFPDGWTNFKIDLSGTLTSTAGSNGVALIEAKNGEIVVRQKLIPEPGSFAALGLAGALLRRSRR